MRGPEISLAWLTPGEEVALTMIEARGADQEARGEIAVEELSFTIRPGTVTGFLGSGRRTSTTPRTPRPSGRSARRTARSRRLSMTVASAIALQRWRRCSFG
jgi:hypothetical protein